MSDNPIPDWDPTSESTRYDQLTAYDHMRRNCPVAFSDYHQWSIFRHEDVLRVLHDEKSFSNVVSTHLSVPNGMDPPQHTPYRTLVERYFIEEKMESFKPVCRKIASELVSQLPRKSDFEIIESLAQPFALKVQCAFLGWPSTLEKTLRRWMELNRAATVAQDRATLGQLALAFKEFVEQLLQQRRDAGDKASDDVTTDLLWSRVNDRPLQ